MNDCPSTELVQASFRHLYEGLSPENKCNFMRWIFETYSQLPVRPQLHEVTTEKIRNAEKKLSEVIHDLQEEVPLSGILDSETIYFPTTGLHSDCNEQNTVHIDAFLYDDCILEQMFDEGKIDRSYCTECGSRRIAPLTFISHSISKQRLYHLFLSLLPDLTGKTVLDIGSRLGAVLYGAYVCSNASRIIGIEMNRDFCELQERILMRHGFGDRIQIISGDVRDNSDVLKQADVIIIHCVTDFFLLQDDHRSFWVFMKENIRRPGTILVTTPSLDECLSVLEPAIDVSNWVKPVSKSEVAQMEAAHDPELAELNIYECI